MILIKDGIIQQINDETDKSNNFLELDFNIDI